MYGLWYSLLRMLTQLGGGALFAWLAAQGIDVKTLEDNGTLVNTLATAGLMAVWILTARFLESRQGDGMPSRAARRLGAILMVGLSRQPVYPGQGSPVVQRVYSGRETPSR